MTTITLIRVLRSSVWAIIDAFDLISTICLKPRKIVVVFDLTVNKSLSVYLMM